MISPIKSAYILIMLICCFFFIISWYFNYLLDSSGRPPLPIPLSSSSNSRISSLPRRFRTSTEPACWNTAESKRPMGTRSTAGKPGTSSQGRNCRISRTLLSPSCTEVRNSGSGKATAAASRSWTPPKSKTRLPPPRNQQGRWSSVSMNKNDSGARRPR